MKKPIGASKDYGPLEIIEDGQTGYLIPSEDYKLFGEVIVKFLLNRDLRIKIRERAYRDFVHRFSIASHLHKMEDVYQRVLRSTE